MKLDYSIKKRSEEQSIMEEIKNNEFDKQKEKEKDFFRTYLNSLQKRPISFKNENFQKNADFTPLLYKHPENVYLKAVSEYQNNKEKMKKYNKKTGQFDLYLNRSRKNKFVIVAEDKNDNKHNVDLNKIRLKTSNSIANSKNKNNQNISINIFRGNSTKNNFKNNANSPSNKSNNYTFLTNNYKNSERKSNTAKKYSAQNNSVKKNNKEEKGEITIDEMVNFLLENDKEKIINPKKINLINIINHKKNSENRKKIIKSLNDPCNPYSAIFYNNILCKNYKVEMHYKQLDQGVPHLRIKKMQKPNLPPLNQGNNLIEERELCNTHSSGFNISKKKNNIILPSTSNELNKSGNRKKSNDKKSDKKDNDSNILFQSYGDNTDFVNNDFELPKTDRENKDNDNEKKEKKNLSGIIEEEN